MSDSYSCNLRGLSFFMRNITIFEIIIVLLTLRVSFWLGLVIITYVFVKEREYRHLKWGSAEALKRLQLEWDLKVKQKDDKIKSMLDEETEDPMPEDFKKPAEMCQRFINYANFIIEDYGGWYMIVKPDMEPYPKMFYSIDAAKQIVDQLVHEYPPEKPRRSKIHNIRFVK